MKTPTSVLIGIALWLLFGVIVVFDTALAHLLANTTAGLLMGVSFTVIAWYPQQQVVRTENAQIKIMVARNAGWSHVIYGAGVFLVASMIGDGTVYGVRFAATGLTLMAVLAVGVVIGVFMYFTLELDAGFRADGGSLFWFPVIMFSMWLTLLFVLIAVSGGWVFALALVASRFGMGYLIHHRFAFALDSLLEDSSVPLLILNLMTLPVLAYISAVTL